MPDGTKPQVNGMGGVEIPTNGDHPRPVTWREIAYDSGDLLHRY